MAQQNLHGNTYYVCSKDAAEPLPWEPWEDLRKDGETPAYLNRVTANMARGLEISGLTFYFTSDVNRLPSYGQNVVAVVLGDESCRIPRYVHKVRVVFKCYGTVLARGSALSPMAPFGLLTLLHFGKNWLRRLPSVLHFRSQQLRAALARQPLRQNIYDIPIGYSNQLDLPMKEMAARPYDIGFAGSINHEAYRVWSPKFYLGTPKSRSRRRMIQSVEEIARQHPEYRVKLSITSSFRESRTADARAYSEELMDTKVCLVPRGASLETYRFFEAIRYGCVVVTEALPPRWFYDGSPAVQVEDWGMLPRVLPELLDEATLERMHQESLRWWTTTCSEAAVGAYMAEMLNRTAEKLPPGGATVAGRHDR
ncbi:MAG: glycosyltransferase family 47 protein [Actinomycetota bacterium]|nr:glycosyltransferase family 47 protein [Actinomycetota bacterium]